jgi:hypothetical protein
VKDETTNAIIKRGLVVYFELNSVNKNTTKDINKTPTDKK